MRKGRHFRRRFWMKLIAALFAAGIAASCTQKPPHDRAAIQVVLDAEARDVVAHNLDAVMALWCANGVVRDAKHTPDDTSDDVLWQGKDAIAQRYLHLVFPGVPRLIEHSIVRLQWHDGGKEVIVLISTRINSETAIDGDKWILRWQDGRYCLQETIYNLEP